MRLHFEGAVGRSNDLYAVSGLDGIAVYRHESMAHANANARGLRVTPVEAGRYRNPRLMATVIDEDEKWEAMYVSLAGNPSEGWTVYGPYPSWECCDEDMADYEFESFIMSVM